MLIQTSELEGLALNWVVATIDGYTNLRKNPHKHDDMLIMDPPRVEYGPVYVCDLNYSANAELVWSIFRNLGRVDLIKYNDYTDCGLFHDGRLIHMRHQNPSIALLRCYVASKLGNEVEVPDILK